MGITTVFKSSVLSASMIFLAACADSDEVYEGAGTDNQVSSSETTDSDIVSENNVVMSPARPSFITSDCGSLEISDSAPGNERSTPTTVLIEQLVSGRIDPGSNGNFEHFWRIALEPGSYNVVFDAETVAGNYKYLNIKMTDLKSSDPDDDEVLIKFAESNYRARYHKFVEIAEARTLDLVVTASDRAQDYRFAVFQNGSPVPSPLFSDCPTIERLSIDSTEALSLPEQKSSDEDQWYQVDLEAKDYVLNSEAVISDCESGGIEFEISHVDQFGQRSRMKDHDRIKLEGTNVTGSTPLQVLETGPVWIRIQNYDCPLDLQFTLMADE